MIVKERARRRTRGRASALLATAVACACILQASACDDDGSHVYIGRFYLEGRDCLGTTSALDAVEGDAPGECSPRCFIQLRSEAARAVYVATMCAPYPAAVEFDLSGTDPVCAPALAALARNDTCATDGGSANPVPRDAGAE